MLYFLNNFMDLLLFGMQGAGKGTQGKIIAEKRNFVIFETGSELRKIREENSELGKTVKDIMDRGDLVTNEIVMEIIKDFLEKNKDNRILFDGIPRSMIQKRTFDELLQSYDRSLQGIYLTLPKEEAVSRMLERGRNDDTPEVIERRLQNYEKETLPVIREYMEEGILVEIDGFRSIQEIAQDIENIIL